jgi:hypothetical protein
MLLQVPKNIGGAKVRTAAVTAAVTGTTVMFEYQPSGQGDGDGYMKVICIEGSLDLSLNDDPSTFQTIKAGQLSISKLGSGMLGAPVDVDLKVLLKTSKLLNEGEETPNKTEVSAAVQTQQKELSSGTLVQTNLVIPGRGTMVIVDTVGNILNNLGFLVQEPPPPPVVPGVTGPPPPGAPPVEPPPFTGFMPLIAGKTIIDNQSTIQTGPPTPNALNVFNLRQGTINAQGRQFLALIPFSVYGYGKTTTATQAKFNEFMSAQVDETGAPWAAFKFEDLFISDTPLWDLTNETEAGDIVSVILSSLNGISVGPEAIFTDEYPPEDEGEGEGEGGPIAGVEAPFITLDLSASGLENFTLYAQNAPIVIASGSGDTAIYGNGQNLAINAAGSDVWIQGTILLDGAAGGDGYAGSAQLLIAAANNVNIGTDIAGSPIELGANQITVEANKITVDAGNEVRISNAIVDAKHGNLAITAKNKILIENSTQFRALMHSIDLTSTNGDIDIVNSDLTADAINLSAKNIMLTDVWSSSRIFQAQAMDKNGWITIGGTGRGTKITASEYINLFGGMSGGGVKFIADTHLTSPTINISGKTVEIQGSTTKVHIPNSAALNINATNHNYRTDGGDVGTYGSFKRGGAPTE